MKYTHHVDEGEDDGQGGQVSPAVAGGNEEGDEERGGEVADRVTEEQRNRVLLLTKTQAQQPG